VDLPLHVHVVSYLIIVAFTSSSYCSQVGGSTTASQQAKAKQPCDPCVPASSIIERRETAHQQPYVYQVCPHYPSIRQPYCTVLMTSIITIDTNEQASTRSNSAHSSPCIIATHVHACCTAASDHPYRPSHHHHPSPISPQAAATCTCTRNPIHNDYATHTHTLQYTYPHHADAQAHKHR
jgi:hypothetical protein